MSHKTTLDKDLRKIQTLDSIGREPSLRRGLGFGFLFLMLLVPFTFWVATPGEGVVFIVVAGVIGGYMALNIGANDVANNMGPAVGARALTMLGALVIAAAFEAAGALLAGSDVVGTISKGIVDPSAMSEPLMFILAMTSALLAAALWINLATFIGAPVSTTHAVVGGVVGVGIAAAGLGAVNWPVMGGIVASWIISPALGGGVAALFLLFIKVFILEKQDKLAAAKTWVPMLVGTMAGAFTAYLMAKGIKNIWKTGPLEWAIGAALLFGLTWYGSRRILARPTMQMENTRKGVARMFRIPLIVSAALLSFAHGANDVANAVGPLAAIVGAVDAQQAGKALASSVVVPGWVLLVGALGISIGLVLFGPKLIHTVGEKITKLDPVRAFCVALSAALTVIAASQMGLPVSSTHIAVGGVFGVGFLREWKVNRDRNRNLANGTIEAVEAKPVTPSKALKKAEKTRRRRLVRRKYLTTIVAAWVITVPLAAGMAALVYAILAAIFL